MNATSIDADYFWLTPQAAPCGKSPAYDIDRLLLRNASVSYHMVTPDPLNMESGIYRGSIVYSVGPNIRVTGKCSCACSPRSLLRLSSVFLT